MKLLDPKGMQNRQRKRLKRRQYSYPGLNFVWHMDSYDKLKPFGGCPKRTRLDLGTENGYIADMQKFLRRDHGDTFSGERSFLYGKSTNA
ncbi:hypothetical protein KUTeg_010568 [Tegillarca granosa]|uniref:Uncharacterized protein n=1 Tax=Tegillarca granosa TaxID=220873 RepID=A0ABQ9F5M3_TEGGR|nr:hypothetical protein KUTeg_010568 [Tegillarca granosa]